MTLLGSARGPMLVLVITENLRSCWRAGLLAAAAPLDSDVVVVAGVLLILQQMPPRTLPSSASLSLAPNGPRFRKLTLRGFLAVT